MATQSVSRRKFLKLAAGVGGASLLAACAAPTPQVVEKVVTQEVEKQVVQTQVVEKVVKETVVAPAASEQVVLNIAHAWEAAFEAHQEEWDNQFMEKNPTIFIKRVNSAWDQHNKIVPTWAAANQLPDIIYVHGSRAFPWNKEGIMIPVDDFIAKDAAFKVDEIWPEALKLYQYAGKQYEIPYDHGPVLMGYNKDLFDAASLSYPAEDWTWDDFLAAAKKLTDPGKPQWGYGGYGGTVVGLGNEFGIALTGPWGGEIFNDEETKLLLDSAESKAGLQFFSDLINVDQVAPKAAEAQSFPQGAWVAGVTGMFAIPTWSIPTVVEFGNFQWDVAPWPKGPKGQKTGSFGSGYGITRDSKHTDAAWTYLSAYLSKEGMEFMWGSSGRGSPARKAAYDSWLNSPNAPEHAKYYMDALDTYAVTGHPYHTTASAEIMDVFNRNTQLVESGEKTVDQAIADIIKDGQPLLDKAAAA